MINLKLVECYFQFTHIIRLHLWWHLYIMIMWIPVDYINYRWFLKNKKFIIFDKKLMKIYNQQNFYILTIFQNILP